MLKLESAILSATDYFRVNIYIYVFDIKINIFRECVSTGAAGAQTRRSLGHHLLHTRVSQTIGINVQTGKLMLATSFSG